MLTTPRPLAHSALLAMVTTNKTKSPVRERIQIPGCPSQLPGSHCFATLLSSFTSNNQFMSILPSKNLEFVLFILFSHCYPLTQAPFLFLPGLLFTTSQLAFLCLFSTTPPIHSSLSKLIKCKSGGATPHLKNFQGLLVTFRLKFKICNIDLAPPTFLCTELQLPTYHVSKFVQIGLILII